jgi:carbamate kinase
LRVVVALGGRGLPTARIQRASVRLACRALAPLARAHELVVCHGNGPQSAVEPLIQQELGSELPVGARIATVLTMVEVDPAEPTLPRRMIGLEAIEILLESNCVVVCAAGGVPVAYMDDDRLSGIEVMVDRDLAAALLAVELCADVLLSITDVDAVYADWGTPRERPIRRATPTALAARRFSGGSMGAKVRAACSFVELTGGMAAIGSIADTAALLAREAGTIVSLEGAVYAA